MGKLKGSTKTGGRTRGVGNGGQPVKKMVSLRLSPATLDALAEMAATWGCDRTTAIERCVAAFQEFVYEPK